MLTINQINNMKYNPSFSSKVDYSAIYKEMEKISLTQEEKILPKVNKSTKNILKAISPKFKGVVNKILFKLSLSFGIRIKKSYFLKEKNFPYGYIRLYDKDKIFGKRHLWGEHLEDGTKEIYSVDADLLEVYPPSDKRTLKQI